MRDGFNDAHQPADSTKRYSLTKLTLLKSTVSG